MYRKPKPRKIHKGKCPFCDPWARDPWVEAQCVLNKPLWMVIPPGGVHLNCPVHPEGHHVFGPGIRMDNNLPDPSFKVTGKPWCEYDHDPSKDLTYDSAQPYGTTSGGNLRGRVFCASTILQ